MLKERTASFYIGEDQWHCTTYPISEIDNIKCKSQSLIRRAYGTWMNLRDRGIPSLNGFNPGTILREDESGRISRIDTGEDPQQYKLLRIGPGEPAVHQLDLGNPFHRHGVIMEILECKETRRPIFQELKIRIGKKEENKRRLLLPFANTEGHVVAVYTVCCLRSSAPRRAVDFETMVQ